MPLRVRSTGSLASLVALSLAAACGGGDGGTEPPAVATVAITSPTAAVNFATLTRTAQFTAVARDANAATVAGVTIAWNTSAPGVASVSSTGLVTAVAAGTANITASVGGVTSPAIAVNVVPVADSVRVTPATIAFGAIGSTRQIVANVTDSAGFPVGGAPVITFARAGAGTTATVSGTGLVTSTGVGTGDTAVVTANGNVTRIPITVAQLVATVTVSPSGTDTLRTTGRTKQYTAAAADSNGNPIAGATFVWSSSASGTATVGASTGLATAVADGSANIVANGGTATGQRTLVVRRYASTFSVTPPTATITTALGTQIFLGSAQDSVATDLPITWVTRQPAIVSLSAGTGTQVTANATGNGMTFVVMSAGTRTDSAQITVSNQPSAPLTATVTVGAGILFRSSRNTSSNPAVDTIAVGGSVTWEGQGGNHDVFSTGSPSFPNSPSPLNTSDYTFTFNTIGTYTYQCSIHGSQMSGRVVVR